MNEIANTERSRGSRRISLSDESFGSKCADAAAVAVLLGGFAGCLYHHTKKHEVIRPDLRAYATWPTPENTRLMVHSEATRRMFCSTERYADYLVWLPAHRQFELQHVTFTSQSFRKFVVFRLDSVEHLPIADGQRLLNGVIVNQKDRHILLQDGTRIDGVTGDTIGIDGRVITHTESPRDRVIQQAIPQVLSPIL